MTPSHSLPHSYIHPVTHRPYPKPRLLSIYISFPPSPFSSLPKKQLHHDYQSSTYRTSITTPDPNKFSTQHQKVPPKLIFPTPFKTMPSEPYFRSVAKPGLARAIACTNGVATLAALEATGTDRARIAELTAKKEERERREGKVRRAG